VIVVIF